MRSAEQQLTFDDHEPGLKEIMALAMGPGAFLDIGAGVGKYAIQLAHLFTATVAVEAHPWTFQALLLNAARSGIESLSVVNVAAWDRDEQVRIVSEGWRSRVDPEGDVEVTGLRGDVWQGLAGRVRLVKIDVEGAEGKVLRGMRSILTIDKPLVVIEMHDNLYGKAIREEVELELECADYIWWDAMQYGAGLKTSHFWLCRAR